MHIVHIDQINPNDFVPAARQEELFGLARTGYEANAIRLAIREAVATADGHSDPDRLNPDIYVPNDRQVELMDQAPVDPVGSVQLAIREAVAAALI